MRIITLYQPFATLMVMGLKTNETRSWPFEGVTGTLGIAAAAKTPKWCKELLSLHPFCVDLKGIALPAVFREPSSWSVISVVKTSLLSTPIRP